MSLVEDFTVEVRRDGLLQSSYGRFKTLFDATRAALDLVEQLGRSPAGIELHVEIRRSGRTFLDIKVVPGESLGR
jgi:hypothetical protein